MVEKSKIITGEQVEAGDVLIGLASSGPHSNGYSLIRKIIEVSAADLDSDFDGTTLGDKLLAPTRIYVKPLLELINKVNVHAMAHITGGGLLENLPRVMPDNTQAQIDRQAWQQPAIFDWLREQGNVDSREMYRTFNCGLGMVLAIAASDVEQTLSLMQSYDVEAWQIGQINTLPGIDQEQVVIR